jgi:hypothetical protein
MMMTTMKSHFLAALPQMLTSQAEAPSWELQATQIR